ncbi:MAG: hypothetical protein Q7R86_01785 [bacterium]|nr:hypothetical protein [bacterium]
MNFAFYLVERFFYRVASFLHNWYVHGIRNLTYAFVTFFENIDRSLALKITIRYFFQPLYKDFSFLGRVLGIIFRSFRIVAGLTVYIFFGAVFILVYAVWILALPALIFFVIHNFYGLNVF